MIICFYGCRTNRFEQEIIFSELAPKPIGPYSQAIKVGKFVFVSGQIGINPLDGQIPERVEDQFMQIMENLKNILAAGKSDLSKVVKVTIYLKDMNDFEKINKIYSSYFKEKYPARETVEVSRLPKDAKVEISVIAILGKRK
ncbi:MAG: RidA family protein [Ignavibacteria bacterium]|nr:RidA family protein [Ignavibacteria bacterium]